MADATRKVLVEVEVKPSGPAFKIDFEPVKKGEAEVAEAVKSTTDAIQEGVRLLAEEQAAHRRASDAAKKAAEEKTRAAKEVEKRQKEQIRLQQEAEKQTERITEANIRAGDAFKSAGEGAFTLVRGVALLGAASEEDLQKFIKQIAQIQGAFDIAKGGFETIKGLVEGMRALGIASEAQAAKNAALAASNTAVGTSATAAAGGLTAMQAAAGPLGLAMVAVTSVLAAMVLHQQQMNAESERAKQLEEQAIGRRRKLAEETKALGAASEFSRRQAAIVGGERGRAILQEELADQQAQGRVSGRDLADLTEASESLRDRLDALRELERIGITTDLKVPDKDTIERIRELQKETGVTGSQSPAKARAETERQLSENLKERLLLREQQATSLREQEAITTAINQEEQRQLEKRRQTLEVQKDLVAEARKEGKAKLDAARQLQFAQEDLATRLEFGFKGREKAQAKRLAEKAASGEAFTRSDVELERRLGLGLEAARTAERRIAEESGALGLAGGLSAGRGRGSFSSERSRLESEARFLFGSADLEEEDVTPALEDIKSAIREAREQQQQIVLTILGAQRENSQELSALRSEVDAITSNLQESG